MFNALLKSYLKEKTADKSTFSLSALKKEFPKEKVHIEKLRFIGLIDIVNSEFPDSVRAYIY